MSTRRTYSAASLSTHFPQKAVKNFSENIGNYYHYIVHLICLHLVPNHPLSPLSLSLSLTLSISISSCQKRNTFSSLLKQRMDVLLQSSLLFVVWDSRLCSQSRIHFLLFFPKKTDVQNVRYMRGYMLRSRMNTPTLLPLYVRQQMNWWTLSAFIIISIAGKKKWIDWKEHPAIYKSI